MKLYYINHNGKKVDLTELPYIVESSDILNWIYDYSTTEGTRNKSGEFKKKAKTFNLKIAIVQPFTIPKKERQALWNNAANYLTEVFEEDVINNIDGKIYTETGFYFSCKIIGSEKNEWIENVPIIFNSFTVLSDNPVWIKEVVKQFIPGKTEKSYNGYNYPYNYPYNYTASRAGNEKWDTAHYAASDFEMIIYGPCIDPRINIAGHPYEVFDTVEKGEYIKINSMDMTIVKYRNNGSNANLWDLQGKEYFIFEKIPGNTVSVNWSGTFGFDIKLFKERSEPKW